MFRYLLCLLVSMLLTACQSLQIQTVSNENVLADDKFEGFEQYAVESSDDIFRLGENAKIFAKDAIKGIRNPQEQVKALANAIFSRSEFNLLYRADANTVAQTTFENRAANCLSLSIMTYALADELGFGARFQHIEIPEYWTRREGQRLLNSHINLQILPKQDRAHIELIKQGFEVDFDAQATKKHDKRNLLSQSQVVSLFYNNKGSDALLHKNYLQAYAYFRAAYLAEPKQAYLLANLGYLYRLNSLNKMAEQVYLLAIDIDRNNLTAWQNLAFLYKHINQDNKASEILADLEKRRVNNPFYHISLGDSAYERQEWQQALNYYRKALRLDGNLHEVFFGLAKTYYELGEFERSEHFLKLAKQKSRSREEQHIYAGKIEFLRRHTLGISTS
jgi:tetratricopeptide (TPR) repeat protein